MAMIMAHSMRRGAGAPGTRSSASVLMLGAWKRSAGSSGNTTIATLIARRHSRVHHTIVVLPPHPSTLHKCATHSTHLLAGLLQSSARATVARTAIRRNVTRFRRAPPGCVAALCHSLSAPTPTPPHTTLALCETRQVYASYCGPPIAFSTTHSSCVNQGSCRRHSRTCHNKANLEVRATAWVCVCVSVQFNAMC